MRFFRLFSFFILSLFLSLKGFSGTIKGYITDKSDDAPVIGAAVMLHGTPYGTTTGLDGSYELKNVPAGSYDLEVVYSTYAKYSQHITITGSETLQINSRLEPSSKTLNEVQIKATYKNGSDEQARNIEKNNDNVLSIMSARTIELSPDITIANVLQRVSGVQVQRDANGEARYATILGMDKRYNYTTVNGVMIASPDDKMRYVPLDVFPAELVDRVEVIKTLTPDMEGDAVGGVTNLVMKKAPDHLVIYATAATGYNQNSFDEHYNSFSRATIPANDPATVYGPNFQAGPSNFQLGSSAIKHIQAPPNDMFSLSLGNRFLKNKLGVMVSGSYQNTYKIADNTFFKAAAQPVVLYGQNNSPEFDDLYLRTYSTQESRTGIHTNVDYRFNDRNSVDLYGLFTQLNTLQDRYSIDSTMSVNRPGPGLGPVSIKDRTSFTQTRIANLTLKGRHILRDDLELDWTVAGSSATRDVPDMTEFGYKVQVSQDTLTGKPVASSPIFSSISKSWERTKDQDLQGFLNLTYKPTIFGKTVEFKTGGMYRTADRNNYYNDYSLQPKNPNLPYTGLSSIADTSLYLQNAEGDPGNALTYKENEQIYGGYLQAKAKFFDDRLQVLAGVRAEHTHIEDSLYQNDSLVNAVAGKFDYTDVLPSVHLKYKLSDKENIRLSYFESISRPGPFEITGYHITGEEFDEYGNPHLNHSVAQNFDARYEWYPRGIDQIMVGAFYKDIANPIENVLVRLTGPSAQQIQPVNLSGDAINYGGEFQVTKYFHRFGVSANYTYTHSAVNVDRASYVPNPNGMGDTTITVKQNRPMQGQAAHVANLSLLYRNPKLGLDAKLSWQYTGRHTVLIASYLDNDYYQKGTSFLDFSCEKKITRHLAVYVKVNNILNAKNIVEMDVSNKNYTDMSKPLYWLPYQNLSDGKILVEKTGYGQNYLIGVRFKMD
jgi:TonB dependent receptor/CarboxypepD_reg-like domain/TonB-dependent Receptor Plug Domain